MDTFENKITYEQAFLLKQTSACKTTGPGKPRTDPRHPVEVQLRGCSKVAEMRFFIGIVRLEDIICHHDNDHMAGHAESRLR